MTVEKIGKTTVVGAGPVGCLLATILARRGFEVELFEKRADMRRRGAEAGRSINLVLTDRGLRALDRVGLREEILELTVPVLGRMMHSPEGELAYQPYGRDNSECNYSVSRGMLNEFLLDAAENTGVEIHFQKALDDVDFDGRKLFFEGTATDGSDEAAFDVLFGCDGAPSAVRRALVNHRGFDESISLMNWGYKELVFPAGPDGDYLLEKNALHIWPRGNHFLMGLANLDGSFTGTLYLPTEGEESFEQLVDEDALRTFFEHYYSDAIPLLGDFVDEFLKHPRGTLGTVRTNPWNLDGRVLLVGDAAHGIVPFFGQGLNSGFEDCVVLDELIDVHDELEEVFTRFYDRRKPNTDAIADMALENAVEMGEKVGNPQFLMKKKVESIVEKELGEIYRSRYAMVMYSRIPYAVAYEIGEEQKQILAELTDELESPEDVDLTQARRLIEKHLIPVYEHHNVDMDFSKR